MKANKSLAGFLGAGVLGASLVIPNSIMANPELHAYNGSASINGNEVRFILDGDQAGYLPFPAPSFEIYREDASARNLVVGVGVSTNSYFICPLEYNGGIPNGIDNYIYFYFQDGPFTESPTNNFPSCLLITAKIQTRTYTNVLDVAKAVNESGLGYVDLQLPNVTNAVSGDRYGTNWVNFVSKSNSPPTIDSLLLNTDGTGTMNLQLTNVLAGEYLTPEYCTDLTSGVWVSDTDHTTYVPVTLANFGMPTSAVISNVAASASQMFYRVKVE